MEKELDVRIDKYLWAVRVFKTRSIATDEINKNRVTINGIDVKPSRIVKPGDVIAIRKPPAVFTYKVLALLTQRISASLVSQYAENLTPESEIQKQYIARVNVTFKRDKGAGRPTKKDRRDIEELGL